MGAVEFEYWVENVANYESVVWFAAAGATGLGVLLCIIFAGMNMQAIGSSMSETLTKMLLFKGKAREWIAENAPTVMPMYKSA